jgi:hypothetical protein
MPQPPYTAAYVASYLSGEQGLPLRSPQHILGCPLRISAPLLPLALLPWNVVEEYTLLSLHISRCRAVGRMAVGSGAARRDGRLR